MLSFALSWVAAAHGGAVGGLVVAAINLPRVLLTAFGGAVCDRFGVRRILIIGDGVMFLGSTALAALSAAVGPAVWLLVTTGVLLGAKDAFYLPASGTMPLLLVPRHAVARAVAMRHGGAQLAAFLAGPLAGLLVGMVGLTGTALLNAATFAIVLGVVIAIRPGSRHRHDGSGSVLRDTVEGLKVALRDPVLRAVLSVHTAGAAFVLPVVPVLVPLMAQRHGWAPGVAGAIAAAECLGLLSATVVVLLRGPYHRSGVVACVAVLVAATGIGLLAASATVATATVATVLAGVGTALFVLHTGPLMLLRAPHSHASRVQALTTLGNSVALLVMSPALGTLAAQTAPATALACCAGATALTGLAGLAVAPLRSAVTSPRPVSLAPGRG